MGIYKSADPVVAVMLNLMHVCKSPQVHNVGGHDQGFYSFDQLESFTMLVLVRKLREYIYQLHENPAIFVPSVNLKRKVSHFTMGCNNTDPGSYLTSRAGNILFHKYLQDVSVLTLSSVLLQT